MFSIPICNFYKVDHMYIRSPLRCSIDRDCRVTHRTCRRTHIEELVFGSLARKQEIP
jgi:hypothetical protein